MPQTPFRQHLRFDELAAACRYSTQALGDEDLGRKDMLMDIATQELGFVLKMLLNMALACPRGDGAQPSRG